jgi:hypothetical protein
MSKKKIIYLDLDDEEDEEYEEYEKEKKQKEIKNKEKIKKLVESIENPNKIDDYLNQLIKLGHEKGPMTHKDFMSNLFSKNISSLIVEKYKNKCGKLFIEFEIDKNGKVYIMDEKKIVEKIIKCIILNKYNRILIYTMSRSVSNFAYYHANILLINQETKQIIRFEPYGIMEEDEKYFFNMGGLLLTNILNEKLKEKYKYINVHDLCPDIGFQKDLKKLHELKDIDIKKIPLPIELLSCVLWSRLFSELIMAFPKKTYQDIFINTLLIIKSKKTNTIDLIRGYFWYIKENLDKIDIKMKDKIQL